MDGSLAFKLWPLRSIEQKQEILEQNDSPDYGILWCAVFARRAALVKLLLEGQPIARRVALLERTIGWNGMMVLHAAIGRHYSTTLATLTALLDGITDPAVLRRLISDKCLAAVEDEEVREFLTSCLQNT